MCKHENLVYESTGSVAFHGFGIVDTVKVTLRCLDCLEIVEGEIDAENDDGGELTI